MSVTRGAVAGGAGHTALVEFTGVLGYADRHTSVATDLGHGLGALFTAMAAQLPVGAVGFSQTFFHLSQSMPDDFGMTSRLLNETDKGFNTGSMRNASTHPTSPAPVS